MEIRNFRILILLGLIACIGVAVVLVFIDISPLKLAHSIPLKCPFLMLTGIHCPTCGLGRALVLAVGGQWKLSFQYHPLALPFLFMGIVTSIGVWFLPNRINHLLIKSQNFLKKYRFLGYLLLIIYSVWGFCRWYL